jgi:urease accessory protein
VATLAAPHTAGTAYLKFVRSGPRTVVVRSFAASPVKLFATRGGDAACWVYAATLGGGLLGGDRVELTADVGAGARALLTTQASTKVYRSHRQASQMISATVDEGALLAVVPDPVVCFAASNFAQVQRYELRRDASLVVVDWMTSGRHAAGERWAFSRYESRLDIRRDNRRVFYDALLLERDLVSIAERMGRFDVVLTAVLIGPAVSPAAARVLSRTAHAPTARNADLVITASALGDGGLLVRMAGVSVEQAGSALRDVLSFLSPILGDDLWIRKW